MINIPRTSGILASAILLALVASACGRSEEPSPGAESEEVRPQNNGPAMLDPEADVDTDADLPAPAPDFQVETLQGQTVSLADLRGRVVLVNFWATWCGPCIVEMPDLVELHETYADEGLTVLGISVEEGEMDLVRDFVAEHEVTYPIAVSASVADAFGGVYGLPTTFVIDKSGQIIHRIIGLFPIREMLPRLQLLLQEA